MPMLKLRNLFQTGVVSDLPPQDLPLNAVTDALNVRFETGRITNVGGWDMVSHTSALSDQTPLTLVNIPLSAGLYFYATDKNIYSVFPNVNYNPTVPGSTPELRYNLTPRDSAGVDVPTYDVNTDIPAGTKVRQYDVSTGTRWNSTVIANRIVFNSKQYDPISQPDGTFDQKSPFVTLKGWGVPNSKGANKDVQVTWRAKAIHAYKDHLMALNMDEPANFAQPNVTTNIPNRVRWSNYAFENQVPQDWYEDKEDADGGFVDLMDAMSPIVDGFPLRDYFMVYTNSETYLFNYVGGTEVFQNTKLFSDAGILAQGCVVEFEGKHFVVTADDVIIHDGSQKQSVIQGVIRDRLLQEMSTINPKATRVFYHPIRHECWVCYPYAKGGVSNVTTFECNRAAIYNTLTHTWTFADLPDIYDVAMGEVNDPSPLATWELGSSLQPTDQPFDVQVQPWEVNSVVMGNSTFFAASAKHCLMSLDTGNIKWEPVFPDPAFPNGATRTNMGYLPRFVQRVSLDMDEAVDEWSRVKTWRTIYPQHGGEGVFNWTVFGTDTFGASDSTYPLRPFTVGHSYKVDCRITKRYIGWKVETSGDDEWNWNGFDVDYVIEGRR